jgi:hypothetical protein
MVIEKVAEGEEKTGSPLIIQGQRRACCKKLLPGSGIFLGEVDDLSRNFVIHPEKVLIQQIENVGKVFYPEKFISFRAVNQLTGFLLRG